MTPFEKFCKDNLVTEDAEYTVTEDNEKYRVKLKDDDSSDRVNFVVLECLQEDSEYNVGDSLWADVNKLQPTSAVLNGVEISSWDYLTAVRLKIAAETAMVAYNKYLDKRPSVDFSKL